MKSDLFDGIKQTIISNKSDEQAYHKILDRWASHFVNIKNKGLLPLFVTGAGVSMDTKPRIPNIFGIINLLEERYNKEKNCHSEEVDELFTTIKELNKQDKKDRGTIARLLNVFQEKKNLKSIWNDFNSELIKTIINTERSPFHQYLADIHRNYNAVTLTLNFDGLLIREFEINGDKKIEKAFSLPTKEECENYFLRHKNESSINEYLEIQIRGDIFYVKCDSDSFCPSKGRQHSLWAFIASYPRNKENNGQFKYREDFFRKCHACGKSATSFLSFPGSYDKEKSMREMLEIVWRHLAFKIGAVTVVGCSGEWDPLLVAFLGDLLTERNIPMLVIDNEPVKKRKCKYIIDELINSNIHDAKALGVSAKEFIEDLTIKLSTSTLPERSAPSYSYHVNETGDDELWFKIFNDNFSKHIKDRINHLSDIERDLLEELNNDKLHRIAQLGLKSHWLGFQSEEKTPHNRYHHSLGVMKIASYLYDMSHKGNNENEYERQFLRIAALMHDVGHLPFSHLIESVFNELNWKPADYKEQYSHEFQTEKRIDELFVNQKYRNALSAIGYSVYDIKKLINGCYGVGYLDAIINSPIDSDKIDYIFRDTKNTERSISLDSRQFLKDISLELSITPEKHLSFSHTAAMAAAQLVESRQYLYKYLYLQPSIIILEGIVKLIIKTFFVHTLDMEDKLIIRRMDFNTNDFPDLGEYKINQCITKLRVIMNEMEGKDPCEKDIIRIMFREIERIEYLSEYFKKNLRNSYLQIDKIKSNQDLNELENRILNRRVKFQKDIISEIIRDVSFRFPGTAILEAVTLPDYLSSANKRRKRERSDGTNTYAECIMVPKGDYHLWTSAHMSAIAIHDSSLNAKADKNTTVYIYPMSGDTDNSNFKQAVNLIDKLIEKHAIGVSS